MLSMLLPLGKNAVLLPI